MFKKKRKAYIWLAVDRVRKKIVDIEVSKGRTKKAFKQICKRLQDKGYQVGLLCPDGCKCYRGRNLGKEHVVCKSQTTLVENKHSLIRHYLARFHRRTRRYSKALDMIYYSLLLFFHKDLLWGILN